MSQVRLTPMFEQYLQIKKDYADALLFYRMGDFYELFFEDAEVAARELQIALTSRHPDAENPISMCGVPWHSANSYIAQLVNKGFKVAICEQVEDPKKAKGLVKREVVHVYTGATCVEDFILNDKEHNFLAALYFDEEKSSGALAWADISTGFWTGIQSKKYADIWQWVQKIAPKELIISDKEKIPQSLIFEDMQFIRVPYRSHFDYQRACDRVLRVQEVSDIASLSLENSQELMKACGGLIGYLEQTQMHSKLQLSEFKPLELGKHLILDELTERNLELFRRLDGKKGVGTLLHILDKCVSPMGSRLLEERLHNPWKDLNLINDTQECVKYFFEREDLVSSLQQALNYVYDLERLSTRIAMNRTNPKDLLSLRQTLAALPKIQACFIPKIENYTTQAEVNFENLPKTLYKILSSWDNFEDLHEILQKALNDDVPAQITDGGLFKLGYNEELDEVLNLVQNGQNALNQMLEQEREKNNIPKLKMGYNRVFGYYFEITKSQLNEAPEHFIARQSLINARRFTTLELKELEDKILNAADRQKQLEYALFTELREYIATLRSRLMYVADLLANIDFWQALACCALRYSWVCPSFNKDNNMRIIQGRHPVIENIIGKNTFVPNDLRMDEERKLILITGPNMAGKSTILRQTALICILAQMGSFVPAQSAEIGLCDRIFSRVGASDNLSQGQSTFMVEMMETARILRQATKQSFIILDEIGRGTSTFDGLAIAWSVVEDLLLRLSVRTLFATHYHELTALEAKYKGLHNMNIAIREEGGDIVFLRRLIPGPSDRSYGIEVAKLAGIPKNVVSKARNILRNLEQNKQGSYKEIVQQFLPGIMPKVEEVEELKVQEIVHPVITSLNDLDPHSLTPLEALSVLTEWKNLWGKK